MGQTYHARCNGCRHEFRTNVGGGFFFIQVRCEECGRARDVPVEKNTDRTTQRAVGFGKCRCGGSFSEDASPRCPKCRSDNLDLGEPEVFYD